MKLDSQLEKKEEGKTICERILLVELNGVNNYD